MIQLFVGSKRVDLFKDENIEIQDSIQDAKDIGKIFTTFSRTFTVPANKNNNNIFKNFYNFDIVNGFDPREKVRSVITKNGATYRKGFIQIRKVKLKNNKPSSYTIFFTGLLSTLKDKLQDDRLSDLIELDSYNHEYTQANVETGFEAYLSVNSDGTVQQQANIGDSDVCYPFISVQDRYALNDSSKVKRVSNNGTVPTGSGGRVNYQDLKPAIRLVKIIDAIEQQYNITFSDTFLQTKLIFTDLFMFLNRNKGRLGTGQTFDTNIFNDDLTFVSNTNYITQDIDVFSEEVNGQIFNLREYEYIYNITATSGTGEVNFAFKDEITGDNLGNTVINFENTTSQQLFFQITPQSPDSFRTYRPYLEITSDEPGVTSIDLNVEITKDEIINGNQSQTIGNYTINTISTLLQIKITDQIPKLKVIDFLTSIFKMFNLTAEIVDDVIMVQPLDDFYNSGKIRDITRFVDVTDSTVSRVDTIKQFNFKHEDANSLLLVKGNEIEDREYGNLEKEVEKSLDTVLGGRTLDIQTNFYKILYERLRSEDGTLSNIMFGWYVDNNEEQLSNEPIIFYADKKDTNGAIEFKNAVLSNPQTYIAPLNATLDETTINDPEIKYHTTNFSLEVSEYDFSNVDGLYTRFYDNYVRRVFSKQSRKIELDAVLRDEFIIKYRLSDILVYKNRKYTINDIKINLNTNKAKLTLLNILSQSVDPEAPEPPDPAFLELDDDEFVTGPSSDSKQFTVTSNVDWQITGLPTWASTNISSGSNNGTFTISLTSNNTNSNRSKFIEVRGGGITVTIRLLQLDVATLSISPQSATVGPEGGSGVITVTSDSNFSSFTSFSGFINNLVEQDDAGGGGTLTYFYDQNDGVERDQEIRIRAGGYLLERFTLTQTVGPPTSGPGIPCGGSLTASGDAGIYIIQTQLGSNTGQVVVTFDAFNIPDRFQLIYDNQIVADSLFIGDSLPNSFYNNEITQVTTLDKFVYNGTDFDSDGQESVNFSASDIADASGAETRANGSGTGQIGVVANYPTASALASKGQIKLAFNKTTSNPVNLEIRAIGVSGNTGWEIISLQCP